jgi:hypothetical protein
MRSLPPETRRRSRRVAQRLRIRRQRPNPPRTQIDRPPERVIHRNRPHPRTRPISGHRVIPMQIRIRPHLPTTLNRHRHPTRQAQRRLIQSRLGRVQGEPDAGTVPVVHRRRHTGDGGGHRHHRIRRIPDVRHLLPARARAARLSWAKGVASPITGRAEAIPKLSPVPASDPLGMKLGPLPLHSEGGLAG